MLNLYYTAVSMCVSFCIGIMMNAKIKIAFWGAVLGGISYSIFLLCGGFRFGYFIGTLILALLSEIAAKLLKTPTTLFIVIGIYPLVPGARIYKTIMQIIESDYYKALQTGGDTFVNIALMATAIALVSIIFRKTSDEQFGGKRRLNLFDDKGEEYNGKGIY